MIDMRPNETLTQPISLVKPTVYIVGFAGSWIETPWNDPEAELWGMNALHKVPGAQDKKWSRWYQLHDVAKHHDKDLDEHVGWLAGSQLPVFMWEDEANKWRSVVPNVIAYPRAEIVKHFGGYFNNSVSWMIAHAIWEQRKKIGVYGVDMAQDALINAEYSHQRPSCEFFLGWAAGAGIQVDIPQSSDLLKTPFLYGVEEHHPWRFKMEVRAKELRERLGQVQGQIAQKQQEVGNLNNMAHQLQGAIEDTDYYLRAWSIPNGASIPANGKAST